MPEADPFTEEALAEVRSRIGKPVRQWQPFNEVASKDAIRHFVDGYGDANPLYRDDEYAKKTRWGRLVAPPTFLYSCLVGVSGAMGGLRGAHALHIGDQWQWFRPIYLDDRISGEIHLAELAEVKGQFASRLFHQSSITTFRNQKSETVANWKHTVARFARYPDKKREKYAQIAKQSYTPEQIAAIEADYEKEDIRGELPRFWEDVDEGDSIGHVVKGPLTVTDVIAFVTGGGMGSHVFLQAHGFRFAYRKKHPSGIPPNEFGIPDAAIRVHWEDDLAKTTGLPAAYDFGPQRTTWMAHPVTNWMGDDAFLKRLRCELRAPNIIADTTWCRGKVGRKYVANGEHLVDLDLWADNQRGQRTTVAQATVVLPSRP